MELLNNIWNALTTPNETFSSILFAPITFIETTLLMLLFLSILNIQSSTKSKVLYVLIISIISIITNYFLSNNFNLIINYISMIVFIHVLFKTDAFKTIIAFIIPIIIFALVSMFVMNPYLAIFNISFSDSSTIPIYRLLYLFIQYLIVIIIYLFFRKRNLSIKIFDEIDIKHKKIIYANLFFCIFSPLLVKGNNS